MRELAQRRRLCAYPPHQQANLSKHSPTLHVCLPFPRKSKESKGSVHRRRATQEEEAATCCNWRILAHAATRGGRGGKGAQQLGGVLLRLCSNFKLLVFKLGTDAVPGIGSGRGAGGKRIRRITAVCGHGRYISLLTLLVQKTLILLALLVQKYKY